MWMPTLMPCWDKESSGSIWGKPCNGHHSSGGVGLTRLRSVRCVQMLAKVLWMKLVEGEISEDSRDFRMCGSDKGGGWECPGMMAGTCNGHHPGGGVGLMWFGSVSSGQTFAKNFWMLLEGWKFKELKCCRLYWVSGSAGERTTCKSGNGWGWGSSFLRSIWGSDGCRTGSVSRSVTMMSSTRILERLTIVVFVFGERRLLRGL